MQESPDELKNKIAEADSKRREDKLYAYLLMTFGSCLLLLSTILFLFDDLQITKSKVGLFSMGFILVIASSIWQQSDLIKYSQAQEKLDRSKQEKLEGYVEDINDLSK